MAIIQFGIFHRFLSALFPTSILSCIVLAHNPVWFRFLWQFIFLIDFVVYFRSTHCIQSNRFGAYNNGCLLQFGAYFKRTANTNEASELVHERFDTIDGSRRKTAINILTIWEISYSTRSEPYSGVYPSINTFQESYMRRHFAIVNVTERKMRNCHRFEVDTPQWALLGIHIEVWSLKRSKKNYKINFHEETWSN